MRPKLISTAVTYLVLSLAGGGSLMLPDELALPAAEIQPAAMPAPAHLSGGTSAGHDGEPSLLRDSRRNDAAYSPSPVS